MADHDDERESPLSGRPPEDWHREIYPDDLRPAAQRDIHRIAESLHRTSNRVHAQDAQIAVLKQQVVDHKETLAEHKRVHGELRDAVSAVATDARKYAAALVAEFRREVLRMRAEDREVARDERRRTAGLVALVVTVVGVMFKVADLVWSVAHGAH